MATYQSGEIIDITIRGARVLNCDGGSLVYEYSEGGRTDREEVQYEFSAVEITRLLPPDPPKPGEVWRDNRGRNWLAVEARSGEVRLHDGGTGGDWPVTQVHGTYGPLEPVHRDEPDEITPLIARHVLWHYGYPEGVVADEVIRSLIILIRQADSEQRSRLARGYGGYVAAVNWTDADGGLDDLRKIAGRDA